jgi:predicted N-acetyltransferase YhbS
MVIGDCIANDRFARPFRFVGRLLRWSASIIGLARLNKERSPQRTPDSSMSDPIAKFFLEVVPEEEMPETTDQAIRRLLCDCFPSDREAFSKSRAWHDSAPAFSVIHRRGDSILGHVGVVVRWIRCGDQRLTVAGIQNMCVAATHRATGLSTALMDRALAEAARRGVPFGLLFCVPELESLYGTMGWHKSDENATMLDEHGRCVPIPEKNIAMHISLGQDRFPPGPIHLRGRDW